MNDKEKFKEVIRLFYEAYELESGENRPYPHHERVASNVTIRKNLKKIMVILKTREMELFIRSQNLKINEDGIWPPDESELEKVTTLVEKLYKFVDLQIIKSSYLLKEEGEAWLKFFSSTTMIRSDLKEIEKTIKKISRNYNLEL